MRDFDLAKETEPGFHRIAWDLVSGPEPKGGKGGKGGKGKGKFGPPGQLLKPGSYRVVLEADGTQHARTLTVEADPRTRASGSAEGRGMFRHHAGAQERRLVQPGQESPQFGDHLAFDLVVPQAAKLPCGADDDLQVPFPRRRLAAIEHPLPDAVEQDEVRQLG